MGYAQYVGRTADGDRMHVEITIGASEGTRQTVEHGEITAPIRLSVMGHLTTARGRDVSSGQNVEDLAAVADFTGSDWTEEDRDSLLTLWTRWHLNDMRAGCAHMELPAGTSHDARAHIVCPESGYRYGASWLTERLPDDVIAEASRLSSLHL